MTTVEQAYRIAEGITRAEARNFYYGIRLLPREKRTAMCAVYALGRRIDDVADGELAPATKVAELTSIRKSLESMDNSSDPVLVALADAARRFPIPIATFGELIDGAHMDVDGAEYRDFDELVAYCRTGAGATGRLCLSIFGPVSPTTSQYADQLGIALQQTNILRDVREDFLNGRIYLPSGELERFGVRLRLDDAGALDDPDGRLAALLRFSADRAADWYSLGLRLIPHLDRRSAACCATMSTIYRHQLALIRASPAIVYDRRISLSGLKKARLAAAALAFSVTGVGRACLPVQRLL
ncbi:Phytoene synthase [Mycobacterium simulans]|uniref:presqualene diphosphate synthase HpnD n=1 Tax=Mycobacterium simulans TaxID=627089 RepID=UPI00174896FD|nr:presqualene diphosphate synthase HpnD [Mycobacterium simulans]SON58694.1 Phytoene synthase [Mycobacterium simulans]